MNRRKYKRGSVVEFVENDVVGFGVLNHFFYVPPAVLVASITVLPTAYTYLRENLSVVQYPVSENNQLCEDDLEVVYVRASSIKFIMHLSPCLEGDSEYMSTHRCVLRVAPSSH